MNELCWYTSSDPPMNWGDQTSLLDMEINLEISEYKSYFCASGDEVREVESMNVKVSKRLSEALRGEEELKLSFM